MSLKYSYFTYENLRIQRNWQQKEKALTLKISINNG